MVAESTEILRPIDQLGCAHACSGVTFLNCCGSSVRNGPPEAVRMIFSTRSCQVAGSCGKDWKMAECSLSIGKSVALLCCTACKNTCPPMTKASLFASSRRLPAWAAARHGAKPAAPTMAAMTTSTSGYDARVSKPASAASTSVRRPCAWHCSRSLSACGAEAMAAYRG